MGTCNQAIIIIKHFNMKTYILLLVVVLSVAAVQAKKANGKGKPSKDEKEPKSGFCMSEEEMMMFCHAGSALGEKANAAMETCAAAVDMRKGKGKKPSKGKGKCPTHDQLMEMAAGEYAGEMCVFTEMGWIDSDYVSDDALILEDINTLPTEIAEALNSDEYDQCVVEAEAKMMKMMKKELGNKCLKTYTEEEMAEGAEVMNGVAHTECFKGIFMESCGLYISNSMAAMVGSGNTVTAGRK